MISRIFQSDYSFALPTINRYTRQGYWVNFGSNNLFLEELYDTVRQSPLQTSILENKIKYIIGAGIKEHTASIFQPNLTESWLDLIKKCVKDYVYFGAFSVQVVLNESETQFSFYHQPIMTVRMGNYDESNRINSYFICSNWRNANKSKNVVEIKAFGSETPKKGENYLLYFSEYQPNNYYYALPSYINGMNWILADIALSKYYTNYIKNNFSANLAIKYPSECDEDKKAEIYSMLQDSFGGSENSGNILLMFGSEGTLPTIEPIESVNADLYTNVCDTVLKYIVSANRLTSPILAGLATSAGFSSKQDEMLAAYNLYKLTVIDEDRSFLLDKFNYLLQLNGLPRCLELQDYDLTSEIEGDTASNDEKESTQNETNSEEIE